MSDNRNNGKGVDCIRRAVAGGLLDARRAENLVKQIDILEAKYWDANGPVGAKWQANMDALEMMRRDAAEIGRAHV